jgi:phosphate starvation-inducible PhoH-like protein
MEIEIQLGPEAQVVFGIEGRNMRRLRELLGVEIVARGEMVKIRGRDDFVRRAGKAVEQLRGIAAARQALDDYEVESVLKAASSNIEAAEANGIEVFRNGRIIMPRTEGQKRYIETMRRNPMVFSVGPAGTGKTYLAVALAVSSLKKAKLRRIVLARPAVEAGEKLGFLPGDLQEKVNPYLRPLYDAMDDMMDFSETRRCLDRGIVEIVPLAFMRGRTLNDAFVILDEGQNTTIKQMMMFLTRLGENTRAVVTGDLTQTDLPDSQESGLRHACKILRDIEGIGFAFLNDKDIVRHRLVQEIVLAYERAEKEGDSLARLSHAVS